MIASEIVVKRCDCSTYSLVFMLDFDLVIRNSSALSNIDGGAEASS